jgi:hypothetical protein
VVRPDGKGYYEINIWADFCGRPPDDAPTEKIGYYLTEAEALITGPEMEKNANRTELSL